MQAFKVLLKMHMADAKWGKDTAEHFQRANGAAAMLTLLAAQPDLVNVINSKKPARVPWGTALSQMDETTGCGLCRVATFTKDEEVRHQIKH